MSDEVMEIVNELVVWIQLNQLRFRPDFLPIDCNLLRN